MPLASFTSRFFKDIFNFLNLVDTWGRGVDSTVPIGTSYKVESPGFESHYKTPILALRPTPPPIQRVLGFHPGGKADGA